MKDSDNFLTKINAAPETLNKELVLKAYNYALTAHDQQRRANGELYISHPIAVANILLDMKMDSETVASALLHDVVEDCNVSFGEIAKKFGTTVKLLVDGVTKVENIEKISDVLQSDRPIDIIAKPSKKQQQAANFSKLLLAIACDSRVLLIKLADRLHNMRTLQYISNEDRRRRIAQETVDIYSPLATTFGVISIRDELENQSLKILWPDTYREIIFKLKNFKNHDTLIHSIELEISKTLIRHEIPVKIMGRAKQPHSVWNKMKNKNIQFEQLQDITGFRIIVDTIDDCYKVFGILHTSYTVIPKNITDHISMPKANGYQSLHTALMGPYKQRIEIQIRTQIMHQKAEFGVALEEQTIQEGSESDSKNNGHIKNIIYYQNHWPDYKQGQKVLLHADLYDKLREIHKKSLNKEEFMENSQLELFYNKKVFCFSPDGIIKELPEGATPVDFAYSIHSAIGNNCKSAKVNGKIVPLMTRLKNGDQVEIITASDHHPSHNWEDFVVTGKAKVNIRKFIASRKPQELAILGKAIVKQMIAKHKLEISEEQFMKKLSLNEQQPIDKLYSFIAKGTMNPSQYINKIIHNNHQDLVNTKNNQGNHNKQSKIEKVVIANHTPGLVIHHSTCCNPVPGDQLVGIVVYGKGINIHTTKCDIFRSLKIPQEDLIYIELDETDSSKMYIARISIIADDTPGALSIITNIIADNNSNITNIRTIHIKNISEIFLEVHVTNSKHLANIINQLRSCNHVSKVSRI